MGGTSEKPHHCKCNCLSSYSPLQRGIKGSFCLCLDSLLVSLNSGISHSVRSDHKCYGTAAPSTGADADVFFIGISSRYAQKYSCLFLTFVSVPMRNIEIETKFSIYCTEPG